MNQSNTAFSEKRLGDVEDEVDWRNTGCTDLVVPASKAPPPPPFPLPSSMAQSAWMTTHRSSPHDLHERGRPLAPRLPGSYFLSDHAKQPTHLNYQPQPSSSPPEYYDDRHLRNPSYRDHDAHHQYHHEDDAYFGDIDKHNHLMFSNDDAMDYSEFGLLTLSHNNSHNVHETQDPILQQHLIEQTIAWEQIQKQAQQHQSQQRQNKQSQAQIHNNATGNEYNNDKKDKRLSHTSTSSSHSSSSSSCLSATTPALASPPVDTDDEGEDDPPHDNKNNNKNNNNHNNSFMTEKEAAGQDSETVRLAEERVALGQCPACGQQLYELPKVQPSSNSSTAAAAAAQPSLSSVWSTKSLALCKRFWRFANASSPSETTSSTSPTTTATTTTSTTRTTTTTATEATTATTQPLTRRLRRTASRSSLTTDQLQSPPKGEEALEQRDPCQPNTRERKRRNSSPRLSIKSLPGADESPTVPSTNNTTAGNTTITTKVPQRGRLFASTGGDSRLKPLHIPGLVHRGQCVKCTMSHVVDTTKATTGANNDDDEEEEEDCNVFLRDESMEWEDEYLHNSILQPLTNTTIDDKDKTSPSTPSAGVNTATTPSRMAMATYSGPVDEHGERHGMGILKWSNGDVYKGNFVHGVRQGPGTLTFAPTSSGGTGGEYVGDWFDNVMHGQGTRRYPNGDLYTGPYYQGQRQGRQGRFYFANGDLYVGDWYKDCMHGTACRYYYHHGQRFEGDFQMGQRHGKGKLQRLDGTLDIYRYEANERSVNSVGIRWSADRRKAWKLIPQIPKKTATTTTTAATTTTSSFVVKKQSISIAEAVSIVYSIENYDSSLAITSSSSFDDNGNTTTTTRTTTTAQAALKSWHQNAAASGHLQDVPTISLSDTIV